MSTPIAIDPITADETHASTIGIPLDPHTAHAPFLRQIDRIMQSNELSGAEVLRRLLRYLADKTISGEADDLKEYTVAIDGLGKPASYDPRHTSAVRIQAGRLRQKLIDYYRGEGVDDSVIISLPKGHFRLSCRFRDVLPMNTQDFHETRDVPATSAQYPNEIVAPGKPLSTEIEEPGPVRTRIWKGYGLFVWIAIASIALNVYFWTSRPGNARATDASGLTELTPALKDIWNPFIASKRPLMLVLEDPLFVEFRSGVGIYYRDKNGQNTWDVVANTPGVKKLREVLNNPPIGPSRYYTAFGEARAAFVVGRLFGNRNQNFFTLARASEVSSAQLASNNILSVGIPTTMFEDQLQEMPIQTQFQFAKDGIRNLHPDAGEPAMYSDQFSTTPLEQGTAYALVSHLPGPQRNTDVESFVGNRSAAYVAAVEAFADPDFAKNVVAELRAKSGGKLPRYYQVVLKVSFRNSVPTETTCVSAKELQ